MMGADRTGILTSVVGHRRGYQVRVGAQEFRGYITTNIRLWFRRPGTHRDGPEWLPTRTGIAILEEELDDVIAALQSIRDEVHDRGRYTFHVPEDR